MPGFKTMMLLCWMSVARHTKRFVERLPGHTWCCGRQCLQTSSQVAQLLAAFDGSRFGALPDCAEHSSQALCLACVKATCHLLGQKMIPEVTAGAGYMSQSA